MSELFSENTTILYEGVPTVFYMGLLAVFCLAAVLLLSLYGMKKGTHLSAEFLLIEYVFLLLASTVFFRQTSTAWVHRFSPFWSYSEILNGGKELIVDNVLNVLVFVPVGLLISVAFSTIKWWQTLLLGLSISFSIESLQYFMNKGCSEFDDLLHNTIGCMLGFGLYSGIVSKIKEVTT